MSEQRGDGDFEIVEFGRRDLAAHHPEAVLAPLDLSDRRGAADPDETRRRRQWVVMAVVFAIGVVGGVIGWQARTEALDAASVDLLATSVGDDLDDSSFQLSVTIDNLGSREVTVLDVSLPGWAIDDPEVIRDPVPIPAGSSAILPMSAEPRCGAPMPHLLDAVVKTAAGEVSTTVPLAPVAWLEIMRDLRCRGDLDDMEARLHVGWAPTSITDVAPETREMAVDLFIVSGAVEITAVDVAAAGFDGVATNLPITVDARAPAELIVRWTVTDCVETLELGDVDLTVTATTSDDAVEFSAWVPPWLIIELARFAVQECGP